jgi:fructose-1,6-bisphosphatase I
VTDLIELEDYLRAAAGDEPLRRDTGRVVLAMAGAGRQVADLLAAGPLAGNLAAHRGDTAFGDTQKELDLRSNEIVLDALRAAPVRSVASEEMDDPLALDPAAKLVVAVDPLDGSSNIDTNAPIGTIFSVLPALDRGALDDAASDAGHFLQPGTYQVAAGFLIYGAQTALVLTLGDGTRLFTLDRASGRFLTRPDPLRIAPETREYAINASNWRHWDEPVRSYVSHCLMGASGPRGADFNTRWLAALVGEAFRILRRGGIYLYPGDSRPGYEEGRLRLTYEGNPIALLIEQAGGAATDGRRRILDLRPRSLHQRIPLVFGSAREVECVRLCYEHERAAEAHPLFGSRKLFRSGSTVFGAPACP